MLTNVTFLSFLCVQKEAKPEVVMVKVEDVEMVNHTGLSIQEGEWTHPLKIEPYLIFFLFLRVVVVVLKIYASSYSV